MIDLNNLTKLSDLNDRNNLDIKTLDWGLLGYRPVVFGHRIARPGVFWISSGPCFNIELLDRKLFGWRAGLFGYQIGRLGAFWISSGLVLNIELHHRAVFLYRAGLFRYRIAGPWAFGYRKGALWISNASTGGFLDIEPRCLDI